MRSPSAFPSWLTRIRAGSAILAAALGAIACSQAPRPDPANPMVRRFHAPEARSAFGVVASGAVDATRAGVDILERGGNAIDAAVATAFTLAVVDPGGSGLGGMTLALVRLADGRAVAVEGSCPTPLGIDQERLARLQDAKIRFAIEYVATPASLAALAHLAERYGTLPLEELITPAIDAAECGFRFTPFQRAAIELYIDDVRSSEHLPFMILDNARDLPDLAVRRFRPGLARTLRLIAERGPDEFYRGSIAAAIEADMIRLGGFVRRSDLALVSARELAPVRGSYRGTEVYSYPSPGSGSTVIEALNILERFPSSLLQDDSADRLQLLSDVFRIALVDRHRFRPDPNLPSGLRDQGFLSQEFATERARKIQLGRPLPADEFPPPASCRDPGELTTQISVIDRWGNAVSMTQTLGNFYGCQAMLPDHEIVYNNLLQGACEPQPRRIDPVDMSPTIVVRDGRPLLALGSAGSSRIPSTVALVISNLLDRGMGLGQAIAAPRVLWGGGSHPKPAIELLPPITMRQIEGLKERGYPDISLLKPPAPLGEFLSFGGVNAVLLDHESGILVGVGDPRRDGVAAGARF